MGRNKSNKGIKSKPKKPEEPPKHYSSDTYSDLISFETSMPTGIFKTWFGILKNPKRFIRYVMAKKPSIKGIIFALSFLLLNLIFALTLYYTKIHTDISSYEVMVQIPHSYGSALLGELNFLELDFVTLTKDNVPFVRGQIKKELTENTELHKRLISLGSGQHQNLEQWSRDPGYEFICLSQNLKKDIITNPSLASMNPRDNNFSKALMNLPGLNSWKAIDLVKYLNKKNTNKSNIKHRSSELTLDSKNIDDIISMILNDPKLNEQHRQYIVEATNCFTENILKMESMRKRAVYVYFVFVIISLFIMSLLMHFILKRRNLYFRQTLIINAYLNSLFMLLNISFVMLITTMIIQPIFTTFLLQSLSTTIITTIVFKYSHSRSWLRTVSAVLGPLLVYQTLFVFITMKIGLGSYLPRL
jgi:hypothetical protein